MYPTADPRRALATESSEASFPAREPQFFEFGAIDPSELSQHGSRTWLVRSQNLVVGYSEACEGDTFDCSSSGDEMVVLLPGEGPRATLVWRGDEREAEATIELQPNTFTVVPPGTATLSVSAAGPIVRVFSAGNTDLLSGCLNASYYTIDDPNIPPFRPWSDAAPNSTPVSFDFGTVEPAPGRFGRIYRSDSAMVNVFYPQHGPRDPSALSPHVHDSFDQISLQIHGEFVHHVRTSWGPDSGNWRPDEHRLCTGPSIVIFPPPLIHTSQATGLALNQLVDIFGPPRADFAGQPGWLLNAHGDTDE